MERDDRERSRAAAWVLYIFASILFCICALNGAAKFLVPRYIANRQYIELATRRDGNKEALICHERPTNEHYDFVFNFEQNNFSETSGDSINTASQVNCVDYPIDVFDVTRRPKTPVAKKPGEKRIAFVGDSFTFGEGVPWGDAFPQQINKYLEIYGNPAHWEALNFGHEGAGFPELYNVDFKDAIRSRPNRIVYVWFSNDIPKDRRKFPDSQNMYDLINERDLIASQRSGPALFVLIKYLTVKSRITRETIEEIRNVNSAKNPEGVREFLKYVRAMKMDARSAGAEFSVAIFPVIVGDADRYPFRRENAYVSDLLKKEHIPVIDLTSDVLAVPAKDLWVHPINHHPNFTAHRLAARALMRHLRLPTTERVWGGAGELQRRTSWRVPHDVYAHRQGNLLSRNVFFLLLFLYVAFFVMLVMNARSLADAIRSNNIGVNIAYVLIFVLTFILKERLAPRVHLIYNDEFCRLFLQVMWNRGRYDADTYDNFPGALVYYFFFFKTLGISMWTARIAALSAGMTSSLLLYGVARRLWKNDAIALFAALTYAVFPISLRFSLVQAAENPNLLIQLAALFALVTDLGKRNRTAFLLFMSACGILLFVRIYNVAFVGLIIAFRIAVAIAPHSGERGSAGKALRSAPEAFLLRVRRPHALIPSALFLVTTAFYLVFVRHTLTDTPQIEHILRWNLEILGNIWDNGAFFLQNTGIPLAVTFLAVVGIAACFMPAVRLPGKRRYALFFGSWILVYFFAHLMSSEGSYNIDKYADTVRYAIDFAAPLFLLTGLGIHALSCELPASWRRIPLIAATLILLLTPAINFRAIRFDTEYTSIARAVDEEIENYPPDTVFYTNRDGIYNSMISDYHVATKLEEDPRSIPENCAAGKKCVYILYVDQRDNRIEILPELMKDCYSRHLFYDGYLAFCPMKAAHRLPITYYHTFHNHPCCY